MERCPERRDYILSFDRRRRAAVCSNKHSCKFFEKATDQKDYFNRFVVSELNWENYCASTPAFVRKARGTLQPSKA